MSGVVTTPELVIRAVGRVAPQGSKSYKGMRAGHPILVESSKRVKPWRAAVVAAAQQAMRAADWLTLDGPIRLDVVFILEPPKRMPRGRTHPTTYPDLSKVIRATEDALVTAKVMVDDARICRIVAEKVYADPGQATGARIVVRPMEASLL